MSPFPWKGRRRCGASARPLIMYRKTLDRLFDFGAEAPGVTLRLRVFTPLWKSRYPPMVLLCWTACGVSVLESECLNGIVDGLRQEIVSLLRRVSLVERFVSREEGSQSAERIHKVLRLPSQEIRGCGKSAPTDERTTLFPIRRPVLEALIGEPLDGQEGEYEA